MIPAIQELNFPKIDGEQYATLSHATVSVADMGEKTISTQVKIDGDIVPDFSQDWEVAFQGEKYIMPLRIPQGAKENTSLNSTIDLTFQHWAIWQLKRWTFVTMQPIDTGTAVADEEVASVQLNLKDFCDLFGQVLRYYYGDTITIDLNPAWQYDNATTAIEISHSLIWNVLIDAFHDKYGVRWAIEPREDNDNTVKGGERYVIKIGYPTTEVDHIFEYGFEGGLLKLERQVQSEDIRNMIKGRGGDTNIPFRYFKDTAPNNKDFAPDPDWVEELKNIYFTNLMPATYRSYIQGWKAAHISKYPGYKAVGENNAYSPWAYRKGFTDTKFHPVEFVADEITLNPQAGDRQVQIYPDYSPYVKKGSSIDVYGPLLAPLDNNDDIYPTIQGTGMDVVVDVEQIQSDDIEEKTDADATIYDARGSISNIYDFPKGARMTTTTPRVEFKVLPNHTANLDVGARVLNGYRIRYKEPLSLKPIEYVPIKDDVEIEGYIVKVYTSGGEEVSASGLREGIYFYELVIDLYNKRGKVDWLCVGTEYAKVVSASLEEKKFHNTFGIWVKNIWDTDKLLNESLSEYAERVWIPRLGDREKNTAKVVFTTGALVHEDYEFTIVDLPVYDPSKIYKGERSHWRITLAKSDAELEATGLYVPSTQKQGKAGDTFAFIGTEMTHVPYVVDAEIRLDNWKKDHLGEVKEIKPTFVVTTDRVRLNNGGKPDALINQLRVGNSLRIADKRFIQPMGDRAYETLYLQSLTYTYREPSSDDAALNPDVEIVLSNEYTASANPVSVMQGEISAMQRLLGSISNVEQIVRAVGDKLYLRKDGISDRSLSPTQFFSLLTSGNFRAGIVGGAGWGFYKDENDNWVLEADRVNVRQEMQVNTLVINQAEGRGGMEIDTAAYIDGVTRVVETPDGYICYFDSKNGTVANLFHVDDVAFCNRWTPENQELKFYKRRVIAVGVDNVTLSKTEVNGAGIPAEKDNIIHFGNYTDKTRQYVKVRDVVGGGYERYIENLDSVNAEGVEYYFVGKQAGESRWFVGNKDLVPYSGKGDGSYIEYINRRFNLNNVTLSVNTTIGDKNINDYITGLIPELKQEDIEGFVNAIVDPKIEGIQNQIDGVIESFFGFGAPTLNNYPANEWTTDEARKAHERDTYTDKTEYVDDVTTPTAGQSWKWQYTSPTDYGWVKIADSDAVKALLDAAKAQDTADGKRRVFTSQPTTPYDKGDLWVNATYPVGTTSTTRDPVNGAYFNDILRCGAPRSTGSFNISDWGLSSNYTDDTLAQQAINAISDYEYLKTAMVDGASQAIGGLFLSSYIKLGSWDKSNPEKPLFDKPWSGLNGIYINGRTPSYFAGGDMVDRFDAQDNRLDVPGTRYATAMVRMDGSAYFAAGNIGFRADGSGWLGNDTNGIHFSSDGSMSFGNGIKININEGEVGLKETLESLLNYVTGIDGIFIPVDKQGNRVSWTSPDLYAIRSAKGFYSDSFITAKGINGTQEGDGSGEGGASYGRLDAWADYSADRAGDVLSAKLGWDLHTRLGNCYAKTEADSRFQPKGDYLTQHQSLTHLLRIDGANGTWAGVSALIGKLSDATSVIEDATLLVTSHVDPSSTSMFYRRPASALWDYVKGKADALYQPKGNYLTADGYPSVLDGRYVKKAGDTMSGVLTLPYSGLVVNSAGGDTATRILKAYGGGINNLHYINFGNAPSNGNAGEIRYQYVGDGNAENNVGLGFYGGKYVRLTWGGDLRIGSDGSWKKVWNENNDGSGSGLDADMLDGVHESALFRSNRGDIPTEFIDLASYDSNAEGYANYSSGTYRISRSGYSDLFINFALNTGSTSALQIKTSYDDNASLQFRKTIDSNRVSGAWRTILTELNIGNFNAGSATKLQTPRTLWGRPFDGTGNVDGDMAGVGSLSASGEIRTSSPNAFRAAFGNYGFIIRNDGMNTYFLFTDKGNELGGWNGLRPLYINNATGHVTMGNGLSVGEAVVTTLKIGPVTISYDSENKALKISGGGLYSESFITAKGISSTSQGSDGGGSDFGLMKTWPTADPGIGTMDALGANLGWQLYTKASANASSISSLSSRITALEGKNYLDALTLAQSGTGNAVTSVSLSADKKTLTVVKGATFALSSDLAWGNITGKPTNFVTTDTAQEISGGKTFTAPVTEFAGRVQVNGAVTSYDTFPELMLHIPGKAYSKFKMDTSKLVHLLDGGDTNWSKYQSLKALSFIRSGGTSSQFLKADGSVDSNSYVNRAGDTMTGLLSITANSQTLTLGSRNNGWAHYETTAPAHWFNKSLFVQGEIYAGSLYNQKVWHAGNDGAGSGLDADLLDGYHYNRFVFESDANHVPYAHIATATTVQNHATNAWTTNYLLLADISDWDDTSTATQRYASFTGRIWTFRSYGSAEMFYGDVIAKAAKWGSGENQRNTVLRSNNMQFTPCVIAYNGKTWLAVRLQASFRGDVKLEGVMYGLSPVMSCVEATAGITETLTMETVGYGEAASAERLRGTYSLWGQSFYGNNVKGNIASDHFMLNDVARNPYLRLTKDSFDWHVQAYDTKLYLGTTHTKSMSIDKDGKVAVGYGAANPAYALDVNGDIRAMGWLRLGTWGRMGYDNGGWLQMAPSVTNRITALNNTEMTRLEIKSAITHFSGQITNANASGNSTTIAYGAIELSHATPYIDFHFGRSAEDFDVRLINDEAGVLHLVGGSLKLGNGYIRWDSEKGCFAFSHGLYSESFITAKKTGDTTASGTANVEPGGTVEVGGDPVKDSGAVKVQSDEPEQEDTELEALRLRVAQLEQRINALTA